jgi:ATP-dependent RNA helicase SUPV3L1/SUV3
MSDGKLKGLARGIAWRLTENGGVIARDAVAADVAALSVAERRMLKGLGVRFGAFSLFLPSLLQPSAQAFSAAFAAVGASGWTLAGRGLREAAGRTWPVLKLERLDELLRAGAFQLSDQALEELEWSRRETEQLLRALGHFTARKAREGELAVWRRRAAPTPAVAPKPANPASPFAALAELAAAPPRRRRRRKPAQRNAS